MTLRSLACLAALTLTMVATAAQAQEADAPRRTRVALGPQFVPSHPGSDRFNLRPLIGVSRARGDEPFTYAAADESAGFALYQRNGLAFGPAIGFEGDRTAREVGAPLPKVDFTVEAGGFVQYALTPAVRVRAELRKGIGGHKGLIGTIGADYVARDGDRWLVSVGPRLTFADERYHRAYFSVAPAAAVATGLRPFAADGGLQSAGVTAGLVRQFTPRWGIVGYAKYDRLVADPARSPIVRTLGSRNQVAGGLALTYTFGGRRRD